MTARALAKAVRRIAALNERILAVNERLRQDIHDQALADRLWEDRVKDPEVDR